MPRIETIEDVVERQLCTGCGACAWAEPERYVMHDVPEYGLRPKHLADPAVTTGLALRVCPGHALSHNYDAKNLPILTDLESCWGPVLEVHEGHATDEGIRRTASSGGLASALAMFALEHLGVQGVLQIRQSSENPLANTTGYSHCRSDVIASSGSRYSPASPCAALALIEEASGQSVFVGKPCDVAAVNKAAIEKPTLAKKIAFTVGFFCAGVPATRGLKDLIKQVGVHDPSRVDSVKFRGDGWPGSWVVKWRSPQGEACTAERTYAESWGYLQSYRQWRCHICPDHSGEFADIAVGDPWYRPVQSGEPGSSLIVVRSERGRAVLKAAVATGHVKITRENVPEILPRSQKNLLKARGALWGRLLALRLSGAAVPKYQGFSTFIHWWNALSWREKAQSVIGTLIRVRRRGLRLSVTRAGS
jgi:coenzyme F420 hydrogenase subunit beta